MTEAIRTEDFEKLGVFYLGRPYDLDSGERQPGLYLYDSKDLVTHALCLGMTGSGKTGLCIDLLEEAAIDGIPVIAVDPKGDLSNLMLTFPGLTAEEFKPWVDEAEAARINLSVDEFADNQAQRWRQGLAEWGQDAGRIQRFVNAAEVSIFTPGSSAGCPVSILSSLGAPGPEVISDPDIFGDRVSTTATCLLSLIGIDADPITSREHILLSTIFSKAWQDDSDLNLARVIDQIQNPSVEKVGAFDLEKFFPAADRLTFAMKLNNLLAAPGFKIWLEGQELDVGKLFYTSEGKPRISIFSIAHLSESERMFFVSLLLNQLLAWMRVQEGTSSLRSIFYMDEIFGYFPPVANPPSKKPLLTLLKQARAFGLGVVLATQNPADLDYKGLSNIGTWFIGRLQTARDKERVLEGLEVASRQGNDRFDRSRLDKTLSSLGSRIFLVNNVHDFEPRIIETRWAMSYLRGPLSREEIKRFGRKVDEDKQDPLTDALNAAGAKLNEKSSGTGPDTVADLGTFYLAVRRGSPGDASLVYKPMLLVGATCKYSNKQFKVDFARSYRCLIPVEKNSPYARLDASISFEGSNLDLRDGGEDNACYAEVPAGMKSSGWMEKFEKKAVTWLSRDRKLELFKSSALKAISAPGESMRDFRIRLQHLARQKRDESLDKLRKKYGSKTKTLQKRIQAAERTVEEQSAQAEMAQINSYAAVGETLLGAFMGRRTLSRAGRAYRSGRRAAKEAGDVARAQAELQERIEKLHSLEAEFRREVLELEEETGALVAEPVASKLISARKDDIDIDSIQLVWVPFWKLKDGSTITAWI